MASRAHRTPRRAGARGYLAAVTTVGKLAQARRIGRALVAQRLAACVHIIPIQSIYQWRGRIEQQREYRLVCKSTARRWDALVTTLQRLHPYELPAIYAIALSRVAPSYARWLKKNSSPY